MRTMADNKKADRQSANENLQQVKRAEQSDKLCNGSLAGSLDDKINTGKPCVRSLEGWCL